MIRHNSKTIAIALLLLLPALLFGGTGVRATGSSLISTMPIHRFLQLNGTTQYAYIADNDILDGGEDDFGYSIWFKTSSNINYPNLFNKHVSVTPGYVFYIDITTGKLHTILYDALGHSSGTAYGSSVSDGLWHNAVNIIDRSGYCYFFTDGIYITRLNITSLSGSLSSTSQLRIGNFAFNGEIDEARFYKFGINGLYVTGTFGSSGIIRVGTSTGDLIWSDIDIANSLIYKLYDKPYATLTQLGFPSIDNANRTELVSNGTFDANVTGWTAQNGGVITWDNTDISGNTAHAKLLAGTTNSGYVHNNPFITNTSSKWIEISADVYFPSGQTATAFRLGAINQLYQNLIASPVDSSITDTWVTLKAVFKLPGTQTGFSPFVSIRFPAVNDYIYIDNVTAKEIGEVARWQLDTSLLDTNINGLNLTGVGSPTYGKAGLRAQ